MSKKKNSQREIFKKRKREKAIFTFVDFWQATTQIVIFVFISTTTTKALISSINTNQEKSSQQTSIKTIEEITTKKRMKITTTLKYLNKFSNISKIKQSKSILFKIRQAQVYLKRESEIVSIWKHSKGKTQNKKSKKISTKRNKNEQNELTKKASTSKNKAVEKIKEKDKIIFNDLFKKARKKLKIKTTYELKSSRENKTTKLKFEDEILMMKKIIKYLHFYSRFIILKNVKNDF